MLASLLMVYSCQKDKLSSEAEFHTYSLNGQLEENITLDPVNRIIHVVFPESVTSAKNLVAEYVVSDGAIVTVNNEVQVSGITKNNFEQPFNYIVYSEDMLNENEWLLTSSNNVLTGSWGLGGFQSHSFSKNRDYSWYLDQGNTGEHAGVNCGPTSTTMAAKWSDEFFTGSPEDAREAYRPDGGWWYTSDISNYLDDNNIPHSFISLGNTSTSTWDIVTSQLDDGNICILCLDMYYVRSVVENEWRVDKFYNTNSRDWGHFIIVKGYKIVDGKSYFEIYDPYCWGKTYIDGSLKGKDRYYRSDDIFTATNIWWNNTIVVSTKGVKSTIQGALDISEILHQRGR